MNNIFFTGVFLVTILNTVSSNKNVSKELQNSNLTAKEKGTINKTKKEKYDTYVNAETQEIWLKFLAEAEKREFKTYEERKRKGKWSTAMEKDGAVTETIEARERGNNTEREATTNNNFTTKPGGQTFGIGYDRTVNVIRHQMMNPFEKAAQEDVFISEGYRHPYWPGGDSVFSRKPSFNTTAPEEIARDCDNTCNYYFQTYGKVCGHRYNTKHWKNEYKNFANICEIDLENCIHEGMRPNWHPMYRGTCTELKPFPKMEHDYYDIVSRGKSLAPYVYVPPTATPATMKK